MVLGLSKITGLTYLNLCLVNYISGNNLKFHREDINQVTAVTVNYLKEFSDEEKTYIDEWLFKYNFYESNDEEFLTAKKEVEEILKTFNIESDEFIQDIYFELQDLVVQGVINELILNNCLELFNENSYNIVTKQDLDLPNIIKILEPIPATAYFDWGSIQDINRFCCRINNTDIFFSSPNKYKDYILWNLIQDNNSIKAQVRTKDSIKNTSLFELLSWLLCNNNSLYVKTFLREESFI